MKKLISIMAVVISILLVGCSNNIQKLNQSTDPNNNELQSNKNEISYQDYIGKWSYTIEYTQQIGSYSETYEVNIKSIDGNNIIFDYNFYPHTGSATLNIENPDISGTIVNGKVKFNYEDIDYNQARGMLHLKDNKLYLSLNGETRYDTLNNEELTKEGRIETK